MGPFSGYSRTARPRSGRQTARLLLTGPLLCAAAVTLGACSGGSTAAPLTPKQALVLAARDTQRVTSAVETLNIQVNGVLSLSGTMRFVLKPAFEAAAAINVSQGGQTLPIQEIITGNALYIKLAPLSKLAHKPWVKVSFAALSGTAGAGLANLVHSIQSNSFANQAQLLTGAEHAKVVGPATINGVATTEYAGSLTAAAALAHLPPALRKLYAPSLQLMGREQIRFHLWIDRQHHVRRVVEAETVNGQQVSVTIDVISFNQPTAITLPPASQVAVPPAGAFGGG